MKQLNKKRFERLENKEIKTNKEDLSDMISIDDFNILNKLNVK
jgi:hypothetical protein